VFFYFKAKISQQYSKINCALNAPMMAPMFQVYAAACEGPT